MIRCIFLLTCTILMTNLYAQNKGDLPYYELGEYPAEYTAESVTARMIDGLGFRYYWATESLREEDLNYKPSGDARTSRETINHIYGLVNVILRSLREDIEPTKDPNSLSYSEVRALTLHNIKLASDALLDGRLLSESSIEFSNGNKFPFWNNINGPISDALWHVGQVVTFRRSSGNPYNSKASVFTGKVRK